VAATSPYCQNNHPKISVAHKFKLIIAALKEGPVRIIASGEMALADGTPAEIVEYTATLGGTGVHCYSIGLLTGSRWLTVNLWNIDQYLLFDRKLLEEIAHTLRLN
jgi:hypothetical protein